MKRRRRHKPNPRLVSFSPEMGKWLPLIVGVGAVGYFVWHLMYGEGTIGASLGPGGVALGEQRKIRADAVVTTMGSGTAIEIVPPPGVTGSLVSIDSYNTSILGKDYAAGDTVWRARNRGDTRLAIIYKMADGSRRSFDLVVHVV